MDFGYRVGPETTQNVFNLECAGGSTPPHPESQKGQTKCIKSRQPYDFLHRMDALHYVFLMELVHSRRWLGGRVRSASRGDQERPRRRACVPWGSRAPCPLFRVVAVQGVAYTMAMNETASGCVGMVTT